MQVVKWSVQLTLPVISALDGKPCQVWSPVEKRYIELKRSVWNPPLLWMMPDAKNRVVILDWRPLVDALRKELQLEFALANKQGIKPGNFEDIIHARILNRVRAGVEIDGVIWRPFGWGSGAKEFQTLGFVDDFARSIGLVQCIEDYARVARALTPNGLYGGGIVKCRVKFVAEGERIGDAITGDGTSVMFDDVFDQLLSGAPPIVLGKGGQNFQIWQGFAWNPALRGEFVQQGKVMIRSIKSSPLTFMATAADLSDWKRSVLEVCPDAIHHPMYGSRLAGDGFPELLNTVGTTMYVPGNTRIVLPTHLDGFVFQEEGKRFIANRWPIDARSNVQACELKRTGEYQRELERMKRIRVAQHSSTGRFPVWTSKGLYQAVKRVSDDFDVAVCVEDIKVWEGVSDLKGWRRQMIGQIVELEFFVSFTQLYGPESLAFAPFGKWKDMGGDYDGDYVFIMNVDMLPEVYRQASEWKDRTKSYKITKSRTYEFERAWEFLMYAWYNGVGFAVNATAGTYGNQDRSAVIAELARIAPHIFDFLHGAQPTDDDLDRVSNALIKTFTDVFKTIALDVKEKLKVAGAIQSASVRVYNGMPAYITWKRNDAAFRSVIPMMRSELDPEYQERAKKDSELRRSSAYRCHLADEIYGATITQMYLVMRKWIKRQWLKMKLYGTNSVYEALKTAPLSNFVNYAPSVDDVMLLHAKDIVDKYMALLNITDFRDETSVKNMEDTIRAEFDEMAIAHFGGNRRLASYALWRAAHHSRSPQAGAAVVGDAMPVEAFYIFQYRPGLFRGGKVLVEEGETMQDVATRMAISLEVLLEANGGIDSFVPGDYVKLPRKSYQCHVVGVHRNFEKFPAMIGPFVGEVRQMEYANQTRLVAFSDEEQLFQTGSNLGRNCVCMIPRMDFTHEMQGLSAPPPGRYLITLVLNEEKFYRGEFAEL